MSLSLPKFELYEEGSQIRRPSKAVTSAIVEGHGRRRYKADFIKFLIYAQSECDETTLRLDFLFKTESFKNVEAYSGLKNEYAMLSKRINTFIQWIENNWNNFDKPATSNL